MADDTKKVFDIALKASPSPISRPVIVNRGPIIHDPTLVNNSDEDGELASKAEERPLSTSKQIKIQPLDDDVKPESDAKEPSKDAPPEAESLPAPAPASAENTTGESGSGAKDEAALADGGELKTEEQTAVAAETASDAQSKSASTPTPQTSDEQKKQEAAAAQAVLEHSKHIVDLVTSEQYYLPINQVEKRRNQKVIIIGSVVCLLLALAWLDVALDAGLISNTYNLPHTHFFAVKS